MKLSGIYRIKNIITGDCYVGSAVNIERRWKKHQWMLKANRHCNPKLQNSYNKYGVDAFKYEIFEIFPEEYIIQREQERIDTDVF
jgi:group I intron endonuclease